MDLFSWKVRASVCRPCVETKLTATKKSVNSMST